MQLGQWSLGHRLQQVTLEDSGSGDLLLHGGEHSDVVVVVDRVISRHIYDQVSFAECEVGIQKILGEEGREIS